MTPIPTPNPITQGLGVGPTIITQGFGASAAPRAVFQLVFYIRPEVDLVFYVLQSST